MAEDQIKISFECKTCGGNILSLPDDATDESIATCKGCGVEFGTYGAIKKRAVQLAKDEVQSQLRNAFKGLKGWTVK